MWSTHAQFRVFFFFFFIIPFYFYNILSLFHLYHILSHICDEFNLYISCILIMSEFCQYWFKTKKGTITIIYRWHSPYNTHVNVWKRWTNQQSFLFFGKSPLKEKTGSNIKNKVQFACTTRTTMHGNKQCQGGSKLVLSHPVIVQVSILGHHSLDINHSQGYSPIRYGMVF